MERSMYRFSAIIPAFNAESTVRRCLDSVYALPVPESEFEVIVIDDCSSDGTVARIQDYAAAHSNLTLLRQSENHRQGAARNRGVAASKGKYVLFLDSDDEIAPGITSALRLADQSDLEMTVLRAVSVDAEGQLRHEYRLPYPQDRVFKGIDLQSEYPYWCSGPVLYVYSRGFLERTGYPFAEDVLYEDCDFVNVHLYYAQRMGYCDTVSYRIHENSHSTTRTMSFKHACDYALLGTRMLAFYRNIEKEKTVYADSILEGGSYNIMKAFRALLRLGSWAEVRAFYDRFDARANRKDYLSYREPAYCWNRWTRFCLKHRTWATFLAGSVGFFRLRKIKSVLNSFSHA